MLFNDLDEYRSSKLGSRRSIQNSPFVSKICLSNVLLPVFLAPNKKKLREEGNLRNLFVNFILDFNHIISDIFGV